MKVVRLKLTCDKCGAEGWMELSKKDLKRLRKLLK